MKLINSISSRPIIILLISILLNFFLSIYFFGTFDVNAWIRSAGATSQFGIVRGYSIYNFYYPPLSAVILWVVGILGHIKFFPNWINDYPLPTQVGSTYIPIKISIFAFLYLTAAVVFFYLLKNKNIGLKKAALWTAIVYINPAYIFSGPVLGYVDLYFTPFLLLAFFYLEKRSSYFSGLLLAIALSIKLLPILLLPLFLASFVKINLKRLLIRVETLRMIYFCLGILSVVVPIILIFGVEQLRVVLVISMANGNNLSNNAANLGYLIKTFIFRDNITPEFWLALSRRIFYAFSIIFIAKTMTNKFSISLLYKAGIGIFFAYYIFVTGAHENHFFPALVLATGLLIYKLNKSNLRIFLNVSFILFLNLFIFYQFGQIYLGDHFAYVIPQNYKAIETFFAVLASVYSTYYFVRYTLMFAKTKE